jgi:hypothetical protein
MGFTTSIRHNSIGAIVNNPRMIRILDVSGAGIMPGALYLR